MFVRYYVFVEQPFGKVEQSLLDATKGWLENVAQGVSRSNLTLDELGVGGRRAGLNKLVEMRFGDPLRRDSTRTALPFTWRANRVSSLFPKFAGDVEISHWRPATTQLAVSANYEPPLGPVGRVLDRAALHLLAESLVKDLVDNIAVAVEASLIAKARVPTA